MSDDEEDYLRERVIWRVAGSNAMGVSHRSTPEVQVIKVNRLALHDLAIVLDDKAIIGHILRCLLTKGLVHRAVVRERLLRVLLIEKRLISPGRRIDKQRTPLEDQVNLHHSTPDGRPGPKVGF